jgi:SAM-dependent methyltransferase
MTEAYREDLAVIHDAGYGGHARSAAPVLLDALRRAGMTGGLVVDLACGSGILSAEVASAGYEVLGIDIAPAMVELARRRVPGGRFLVRSLLKAQLPPCVAIAAVGEGVNYLFDEGNTDQALAELFRRAFAALCPGGLLLLDAAGPGRIPGHGPRQSFREGDDWAVLVTTEEDAERRLLTRQITSFRRVGAWYRRDHEVHRLRLLPPAELAEQLRAAGFRVRVLRRYGELRLPRGLTGLLAHKPVRRTV